MENNLRFIKELDQSKFIHAANFVQKYKQYDKLNIKQQKALNDILPEYIKYIEGNLKINGFSDKEIEQRTKLLNKYYDFITLNDHNNTFTAQGKFRPTIMEEFMYLLFKDLINSFKNTLKDNSNILQIGGTKAYTNLYFAAKNLKQFIDEPQIGINQKDQDFAIYRPVTLNIESKGNIQANLPVVAIENKTYIDKTMLEGSVATADKIKSGNPYSLFLIVTETYEVDLSVDPAYSRIDQIYVLRKGKRKDEQRPIYPEVLIDLVDAVKHHLSRNWSDIEQKLKQYGRII